jgi:hypothetical protein
MCISLSNPTKFWENFIQKFSPHTIFGKYFGVEGADSKILWKNFYKKNERARTLSIPSISTPIIPTLFSLKNIIKIPMNSSRLHTIVLMTTIPTTQMFPLAKSNVKIQPPEFNNITTIMSTNPRHPYNCRNKRKHIITPIPSKYKLGIDTIFFASFAQSP